MTKPGKHSPRKDKKMARTITTTKINGHDARVINVSKKIETPTGKKIERKAVVNLRTFGDFNELLAAYQPEQVLYFAQMGLATRARAIANGQLTMGGLDAAGKALLKMFREFVQSQVEVMDLSKEDAVKLALTRPKFASLESTLTALEDEESTVYDYVTSAVPVPGDDESDEDEDDSTDK